VHSCPSAHSHSNECAIIVLLFESFLRVAKTLKWNAKWDHGHLHPAAPICEAIPLKYQTSPMSFRHWGIKVMRYKISPKRGFPDFLRSPICDFCYFLPMMPGRKPYTAVQEAIQKLWLQIFLGIDSLWKNSGPFISAPVIVDRYGLACSREQSLRVID
jgi:hypothetical protein